MRGGAAAGSGQKLAHSIKRHTASDETFSMTPEELARQAKESAPSIEAFKSPRVGAATLNEKMKSVFAKADPDGSGLVSEDALRKVSSLRSLVSESEGRGV